MKPFEKNYQVVQEQDSQIHVVEPQQLLKMACPKIDTLTRLRALNDKLDQLLSLIKIRKSNK